MIQKIHPKYCKDNLVQLMIPITENCTIISKNTILFNSFNGFIHENNYINHPKRFLFPYADVPIHEDENGLFANQLLEVNQSYLSIYFINQEYKFIERIIYQKNKKTYLETNEPLREKKKQYSNYIEIEDKLRKALIEGKFVYFLNGGGDLLNLDIEVGLPLSGIAIYEQGGKLNVTLYNLEILENNQILIEQENILLGSSKKENLDQYDDLLEPLIQKKR